MAPDGQGIFLFEPAYKKAPFGFTSWDCSSLFLPFSGQIKPGYIG